MQHKDGLIGVGVQERDYLLLGSVVTLLDSIQQQDKVIMQDNQYTRLSGKLRMFCTGFNSMMSILSLYNIEFDEFGWNNYRQYAQKEYGYEEGVGNYTRTGVECARTFWNSIYPKLKVNSWRRDLVSEEIEEVLKKGYGVVVSYKGNSAYNKDYQTDNILNGASFGNHTYGHVTVLYRMGTRNYIVDSTYGKTYNVYELKSCLKSLVSNGVFYPTAYVMTKEITEQEQKFIDEYNQGIILGITTIPYEEAEQRKRETVVQDVRLYKLIKNQWSRELET